MGILYLCVGVFLLAKESQAGVDQLRQGVLREQRAQGAHQGRHRRLSSPNALGAARRRHRHQRRRLGQQHRRLGGGRRQAVEEALQSKQEGKTAPPDESLRPGRVSLSSFLTSLCGAIRCAIFIWCKNK